MAIWSSEIKELEKLNGSLKGQLPDLAKELERLIKADDENMILLYSRRCLEVIITDLCECELKRPRKTEPLKGIIDKLHKEGKVHSHIISSMHGLNELSTYGTHPKDFDSEQIKPVLNNLDIIIKWYLKYKNSSFISKATIEEKKYERKRTDNSGEYTHKPKNRLKLLLSGLFMVFVIVVVALFVLHNVGDRKQAADLEKLEKSLAVLPFENLSSEEEQLWFSDGITDVIINQLSKISDLRVLGRTSTLKYRKDQKSISEIGAELGVNFIIEGTVQRQENKMRISVQLIRVLNEGHIWSDLYDREWKDIFDVQSDIAKRIAEELKTVLSPEEKEQIENSRTKNPEAYNLYLKGRFFWNKRTEEGFKKSVEYFEKSVAEDPDYALAYAGLADAYFLITWYGWYSQMEGFARAKKFTLRALEIDKNLAEAHATLGSLISWSEWKWEEARKELLLAIKLNPDYLMAHSYYSELLDIFRQNDEARKQINLALELDPFFPMVNSLSGLFYYNEGKYEESLDEYRKVHELDPDNIRAYWKCFNIYLLQGENLKAVEALQKIMLMDTSTVRNVTVVKDVYNKSGVSGLLNWLIESELKNPKISPVSLASWYAIINRKEEALEWLEKAMEERSPSIPRINNDPVFDNLRSEPGFKAIIKKMGLSD